MEKAVDLMTDPEVMKMIGRRLRALRKGQALPIQAVGEQTGLSPDTIYRAERGEGPTLSTVIRLLRAYNRLSALERFIPEAQVSPMALLRKRKRNRG